MQSFWGCHMDKMVEKEESDNSLVRVGEEEPLAIINDSKNLLKMIAM
mgnify:CR=1 FL=1